MNLVKSFPTFESLFSRGDAISVSNSRAILAYPSSLESCLVSIWILGPNLETNISGSAQRCKFKEGNRHNCSVFDICILNGDRENYKLLVGYEDGFICCFSFDENRTKSVPETGVTGLDVQLIFTCDTGFKDFVSAFDVIELASSEKFIFCGAPKKEIVKIKCDGNFTEEPNIDRIATKHQGVSALKICLEHRCVASGYWDKKLELLDLDGNVIEILDGHLDQVQDISFVSKSKLELAECGASGDRGQRGDDVAGQPYDSYYMCTASLDGTIGIMSL